MNALELRFAADTDQTGALTVRVCRGAFAGEGQAWFHLRELEAFGTALMNSFPLPEGEVLALRGGLWAQGAQPPALEHVLVGLELTALGPLGRLRLQVRVGEALYQAGDPPRRLATLDAALETDLAAAAAFGAAILRLARDGTGTARLAVYRD